MTQDGTLSGGEHGRNPPTLLGEFTAANGEHPPVHDVKPPLGDPPIDFAVGETLRTQLGPGHHSVLGGRECCDYTLPQPSRKFATATVENWRYDAHAPRMPGLV